ncbi:hypothetical protein FSP39_018131 [Pinctada imbricata]|uniref:Uncharacterized protein n=1 Tax=Pinctada imbricata TaxID=66713 RepID=A0AA88XNZ3_PINIB|nr:hypothetical protein FSP39_018131 [Pinctada imbricata]
MEQPLDLSQRDSDVSRQTEYNMDVEEPICPYQSCFCPLKHITTLESPKRKEVTFRPDRCVPAQHTYGNPYNTGDFDEGQTKRGATNQNYSSSASYHPKKRKIEMYKQQTMARSSSDNSLNSLDENTMRSTAMKQYREYSPNGGDIAFNMNNSKDNNFCKPRTSPSLIRVQTDDVYMDQMSQDPSVDYRMRTMSGSNMQRAPKKRHCNRHYSIETNDCMSQAIHHPDTYKYQPMMNVQHPYSSEHFRHAQSVGPRGKSHTATATITYSEDQEAKENHMNDGKIDLKSLKADMIREIDNDPDTDDIPTFRKKLFESIMKGAKASKDAMSNPGGKSSALEYLISKSLLHGEDKPFVTKNNHLNQILRGEKTRDICLMDIVELQVEIGLA